MRDKLVLEFWDRSKNLNISDKKYQSYVNKTIDEKLKEDYYKKDLTTNSLISRDKKIKAVIVANQDGIVAGIDEISAFLKKVKIKIIKSRMDGNKIKNRGIILEIHGNARKILSYERTLLNILQRMSGIATLTYNIRKLTENNCFISGTRKTLFSLIDKKSVSVGGGLTHRLNLSDFILIKDNHLKLLNTGIEKASKSANKSKKTKYVEIEVKNEKEALEAAETIFSLKSNKLFAIMFDNMKPIQIKNSIKTINNIINENSINNKLLFEASGNINEKNISEYSKTGVDVISLGSLTHSVKAFDLSLEII